MRTGNVTAHAHNGRKIVVADRALDQHSEASVGKPGTGVLHHRMDDIAIASLDQNLRNRFAQNAALGDGEKMLLAFGAGVSEESRIFRAVPIV